MLYAHLKPKIEGKEGPNDKPDNEKITVGEWYPSATPIGHAGQSGGQPAVHLHIEFRDGAANCNAPPDSKNGDNGDDCGDIGFAGNPVGWDGKQIDGYYINGYYDYLHGCSPGADCDTIFNYDGSAVKDTIAVPYIPFPYYDDNIHRVVEAFVDRSFTCSSNSNCEIATPNKATVFANQGKFSGGGGVINSTNGTPISPLPPRSGCQVSELEEPPTDQPTQSSITFRWKPVDCAQNRYVIRIKTIPNMESGGQEVLNRNTKEPVFYSTPSDIPSQWYNRDLYWSVIPEVSGASWTPARVFRISPNNSPHLSFDHANSVNIGSSDQQIWSNTRDWNFAGTASDSDGSVHHVDVLCSGDTCGGRQVQVASGTTSWTSTWSGLEGLNRIEAYAYDDKQARSLDSDKRSIILGVDLAPPSTILNLNDQPDSTRWPAYFNVPVHIRLSANDNGTRNAISGIAEVRYQIDGQGWQSVAANSAAFDVTSDGPHTIEYYAVDWAGNREIEPPKTFKIDRTPPTPPSGAAETHGVLSGQWQKSQPLPVFTWAASSDTLSGVAAYQLSLEEDQGSHEVIEAEIPAGGALTWFPPKPEGLRTGSYLLRGRARDNAGNLSDWVDLFTFRFDKTPPENPTNVKHTAVITSEVWQRTTSLADFTWPVPHDEGSGINGYFVAWGTDPNATTNTRIATNRFQSTTPLCAANAACTGYLRLRSVDNVVNLAEKWTTAFVLRYDGAPPTADFSFAEGNTTTQTRITLRIAASDAGSGVKSMRFSYDGQTWTPWEAYAAERAWSIPAISRQSWPVYLQVQDGVDLVSPVISHTILLDVNPLQPRSTSYRLFDRAMSAGSAAQDSLNYHGHGTVGQVMDSARISSTTYSIVGGYEASSRALPLLIPPYATYRLISGIFSSSSSNTGSSNYRLVSSFGEPALPNNQTDLVSQQYHLQPGFLAGVFGGPTLPPPDPGKPVPPEPLLPCTIPSITINNAALFTSSVSVTLQICAPKATEMMIGNDSGLAGAQWEPYAQTKDWTLIASGQRVLPRYVYAAFKDADGTIHGTYFDDIIYDPNAPGGNVTIGGATSVSQSALLANRVTAAGGTLQQPKIALLSSQSNGVVDLRLNGIDDNSGISAMQLSEQSDFAGASWEPYTALRPWQPASGDGAKTVYVRFRDSAGNISAPTSAPFILDTQPPLGGIAIDRRVIGPDTITTTVYLGAQDALVGVADMRVSTDANFADAVWQPYTTQMTATISPNLLAGNNYTLYVQYRDAAGNASLVYSDTAAIDTKPPVVYAEAAISKTLMRTLTVLAYDELSDPVRMRLSNDPLMVDNVVTQAYTSTLSWMFDDRRVVWVQVQDSVGNWSAPYPVYAGNGSRIYLPLTRR
jgi:hypothetical protein